MKVAKFVLIVLGLILVAMGVYGIATVYRLGISGDVVEIGVNLSSLLGLSSHLSVGDQLLLFAIKNRFALLAAGAVSTLLGIVIHKRK